MNQLAFNLTLQIPVIIGTLGLWLQAKKYRLAPALGFTSEFTYGIWAVWFHVWGFLPWSVVWAAFYARTWWNWKKA